MPIFPVVPYLSAALQVCASIRPQINTIKIENHHLQCHLYLFVNNPIDMRRTRRCISFRGDDRYDVLPNHNDIFGQREKELG